MSDANTNDRPADSLAGAASKTGPVSSPRMIAGFEIIRKVGQGGMGAVFEARQVSMDRIVALKILPRKLAQDPKYKERFLREARLSAKLNHANLINGIECGEADGYMFYAMEFADGESCKGRLTQSGKLPLRDACSITMQIAEALNYAHSKQLIHRDVKPDNIMIAPNGTAKLCDLGLARSMDVKTDASLTQAGEAVGTPHYISPEQARGEDVGPRTDIYSLGATFYHLVSGKTPFDGTTSAAIMVKHLTEVAPALTEVCPDLPAEYGMIVSKMMAKVPAERYANMTEVIEEFKAVQAGEIPSAAEFKGKSSCALPGVTGIASRNTTGPRRPVGMTSQVKGSVRTSRREESRRTPWLAVAALGVLAGGGIFYVLTRDGTPKPEPLAAVNPAPAVPPAKKDDTPRPPPVKNNTPAVRPPEKTPAATNVVATPPPPPATVTAPDNSDIKTKVDEPPAVAAVPDVEPKTPEVVPDSAPAKVAAPEPQGPDPKIALARTKFLSQIIKRSAKNDLSKVEKEIRDLALQTEFSPARTLITEDVKDFALAVKFEQAGLEALGKSKGTIDLPAGHALRKMGADKVKVEGYEPARGLLVTAAGARMPLAASAITSQKLAEAAVTGLADPNARVQFHIARGELDEAQRVAALLPIEIKTKVEDKLALLRTGEGELTAQAEYDALLKLARGKQWKAFVDKLIVFEGLYRNTDIMKNKGPQLSAMREFAEDLLNPFKTVLAASYLKVHPDGFVEAHYDFSSAEQLKAFKCDHGQLEVDDGYLKVPPGGFELAMARFIAPISELRRFEVTGKTMIRSPRFGVWLMSPNIADPEQSPRCILRAFNMKAHIENFEPPYVAQRVNAMATQNAQWINDTRFSADGTGKDLKWKVNAEEFAAVKLPNAAIGAHVCLVAVGGDSAWTSFKIVFKPDPNWVKSIKDK